ncbi:MAG TPA: hypothetical protein VGS27_16275 [Candidatus Sulfotelmatobacter sp.]|nr:hypothetical protein [Candidatus Sulfotelmatobacter sp.]
MAEGAVAEVTSGAVEADSMVVEALSADTVAEATADTTVDTADPEVATAVATLAVEAIPAADMPVVVPMVASEPVAAPNPGHGLGRVVPEPEIPRPVFMDSLVRTQAELDLAQ